MHTHNGNIPQWIEPLSDIDTIPAAYDLAMQVSKAQTAKVLTYFSQNISVSAT